MAYSEDSGLDQQNVSAEYREKKDVYEKPELKDYLKSYIKKIENRISIGRPTTDKAEIIPIPRKIAKRILGVFAISFMLSIFSIFPFEHSRKS
ncbi:MAG TPA: hypothetical protein ENH94_06050 [Phycisphaerales bacterium]|nr:hypothetical protein [Phycisphaerales bacterium]